MSFNDSTEYRPTFRCFNVAVSTRAARIVIPCKSKTLTFFKSKLIKDFVWVIN